GDGKSPGEGGMEPILQFHPLRRSGHQCPGQSPDDQDVAFDRIVAGEAVDTDLARDPPARELDRSRGIRVDVCARDTGHAPAGAIEVIARLIHRFSFVMPPGPSGSVEPTPARTLTPSVSGEPGDEIPLVCAEPGRRARSEERR